MASAPRVFVSYSWTNDEHTDWVVELAKRLRGDGVDVVLDQWDFKEGHDKFAFMEKMVADPTVIRVLAVCDRRYAAKADGRDGGVGTEAQIISPEVYERSEQEKFIPLLRERDDDGAECLPTFFKSRKYIDFSTDDQFEQSYDKLLRNIFGKPERVKPVIGKPPAHIMLDDAPTVRPAAKLSRLRAAVERGSAHTHVMLQEYLDTFIEDLEGFRVFDPGKDTPFDEAVWQNIARFAAHRDSFVDTVVLVAAYMCDNESRDRIIDFLEKLAAYQHRPRSITSYSTVSFDNYCFIAAEVFLYTLAAFIKARRYAVAGSLMDHNYTVLESLGGSGYTAEGVSTFNNAIDSLDRVRNQRLNGNRASVSADLMKERATHRTISFSDLVQAEFLLILRQFFPVRRQDRFYPRCAVYIDRSGTFELFAKGASTNGLSALTSLFSMTSAADFANALNASIQNGAFRKIFGERQLMYMDPAKLVNLDQIVTAAHGLSGG